MFLDFFEEITAGKIWKVFEQNELRIECELKTKTELPIRFKRGENTCMEN